VGGGWGGEGGVGGGGEGGRWVLWGWGWGWGRGGVSGCNAAWLGWFWEGHAVEGLSMYKYLCVSKKTRFQFTNPTTPGASAAAAGAGAGGETVSLGGGGGWGPGAPAPFLWLSYGYLPLVWCVAGAGALGVLWVRGGLGCALVA